MKFDKYKTILICIAIFAILIRIVFVAKTDISRFQFDFGVKVTAEGIDYEALYENFDKDYNEGRHINYIMHLYKYASLPNVIKGQFYHPPLHHFLMATWLNLMDVFFESAEIKFESMQLISLIYSIIILFVLYKILEELKIDNKNKILPMLLFAFYPLYIYFSGSINNDQLVTLFSLISLLYLIKWDKDASIKNTVIISLVIGLGLMTKSSMYVMIIPAVYVYFKNLNEYVNKDKKVGILLVELLIFIVIVCILGGWFHVRGYLNGLETFGIISPYEHLSIADKTAWERFGIVNPFKMSGVNIWNYLIYSSLNFGLFLEFGIYIKLMVVLAITLVIDAIYFIIKKIKEEKVLMVSFLAWWIMYLFLNLQMPFTCSMHSRYMLVPISIATIMIAKGMKEEKNKYLRLQVYFSSISICLMSLGIFLFIV